MRGRTAILVLIAGAISVLVLAIVLSKHEPKEGSEYNPQESSAPIAAEGESAQLDYRKELALNRAGLLDGSIRYRTEITAQVAKQTTYSILVCGSEADRCSTSAPQNNATASMPPPTTVPTKTGARIRVRLATTMPGEVTPVSTEVQPVVEPTDAAEWIWNLKPAKSGTYTITAVVTVLAADSDEPLVPDRAVTTTIEVEQTTSNAVAKVGQWVGGFFTSVAGILSSLGITATVIFTAFARYRARKRLERKKEAASEAAEAEERPTENSSKP